MARGWESKSIEQQIEDARMDANETSVLNSAQNDDELRQKREGLRLHRLQVLQEMESARNPRYREMLDEKLRHLDAQLSQY
jgi:hypothetical protein